jgi:proline iminopeptidase
VGDCRLYCEVEGEGVPLVLLHGGPGATHHYFHPHFSRAKEFAKVIYLDQRGCGLSDYEPGEGYTMDQAVEDLDKLREALNLDMWVLIGHSYGGFLAQCYVFKHPDRVAGLVLVCASTGMNASFGTRQYDYLSKEESAKIRQIHRDENLTTAQAVYNAHLNGDWKRQSFYRPSIEAIARTALYEWVHDARFRSGIGSSMNKVGDMTGRFTGCPVPTLIMEGKWDLTWGEEKPRAFAENHPGSKLILFERSSHNPFEDEPEKFFRELEIFLKDLPDVTKEDLAQWDRHQAERKAKQEKDPDYIIMHQFGWGRKSNEKIVEIFSDHWKTTLKKSRSLIKLGFAFYDAARYEDALFVFEELADRSRNSRMNLALALIWKGHMLDLLKRRKEAIASYESALALNLNSSLTHDQYGLRYFIRPYAEKRMKEPFIRLENRLEE